MIHDTTVSIGPLALVCGERLDSVEQRVTTYGDASNRAVLVAHALTGSSRVADWWPGLVGEGKLLDPNRHYIIGINALGSCYGSTGPLADREFPYVTVRDIVAAQARTLEILGVRRLELAIGASLGGMQALQWAVDFPERVTRAVMVGAHDHQSAMGIALNSVQRDAIALDPAGGLRLARKVAMLSYKSDALFKHRHDRRPDRKGRFRFDVEGYLEHQADKFETRMEPRSYVALTHAMDSFDVRNGRANPPNGGGANGQPPRLLFVAISSDWLFPAREIAAAADRFAAYGFPSSFVRIESEHGHDAFLAEPEVFSAALAAHGVGLID